MAKSIRTQIAVLVAAVAAANVKLTALQAELAANPEVNTDRAVAGAVIEFKYGKGEHVKSLTGQVIGRHDPVAEGKVKGASQLRVATGEGMAAQLVSIYLPYITKIVSSPVAEVSETEAPATTDTPAVDPGATVQG